MRTREDPDEGRQKTVIFKNGTKYTGNCIKGKKSGIGKYTFKDGAVYDGMF